MALYRIDKALVSGQRSAIIPPVGSVIDITDPSRTDEFTFNWIDWGANRVWRDRYFRGVYTDPYSHRYQSQSPGTLVLLSSSEVALYEARVAKHAKEHWLQHGHYRASHTMGSDPEIFAQDSKGVLVPAYKFLRPRSQADTYSNGRDYGRQNLPFYPDGFAAEFQTGTWQCCAYGVDVYHCALVAVYERLKGYDPQATLTAESVVDVPTAELETAPTEYAQLGCSPSCNAYALQGEPVENGRNLPFRVSGFHLHFSLKKEEKEKIPNIVKTMDLLGGVTSVLALQGLESRVRRRYYGLPGEYRTPEHGLEYRVLSGAALWHPCLVHFLTQFTRAGLQFTTSNLTHALEWDEKEVVECILNLDVDLAKRIVEKNRKVWERLIHHWYRDPNQPVENSELYPKNVQPASVIVDEILYKGFARYIEKDVEKNWLLGGAQEEWKKHSEGPECNFWRFVVSMLGEYHGRD